MYLSTLGKGILMGLFGVLIFTSITSKSYDHSNNNDSFAQALLCISKKVDTSEQIFVVFSNENILKAKSVRSQIDERIKILSREAAFMRSIRDIYQLDSFSYDNVSDSFFMSIINYSSLKNEDV